MNEAVARLERLADMIDGMPGARVIGSSGAVIDGEWHVNIDFSHDEAGWLALEQIATALWCAPTGRVLEYQSSPDDCELYVWADAGLRWTLHTLADEGQSPQTTPDEIADRLHATLDQWEAGF